MGGRDERSSVADDSVEVRAREIAAAFQEDWPAAIEDHLPPEGDVRSRALIQMCHIDLELRWRTGREGRAADYLGRYPEEWGARKGAALELIAAEYELRSEHLRLEDFCKDYGDGYAGLVEHLKARFSHAPSSPRYRNHRHHKSGGLGDVFIADDEQLDRSVALKRIKECHRHHPRSREQFLFEATVTGRLEHPGIVPVYSMERGDDDQVSYAMRFIGGKSLEEAIAEFHGTDAERNGPGARNPALRELLGRFVSVCRTTSYAHSRGILHRDLKPANIMLGPFGETLVVDWGLARPFALRADAVPSPWPALAPAVPDAPWPGLSGGIPGYSSPEQAQGRLDLMGPTSDVYSLGATLYSLLTGRAPARIPDDRTPPDGPRDEQVVPPRRVEPTVSPALEAIYLKAMAYRPAERYESPAALADDLERWLADEPVRCWREPWSTRARRWLSRHRTPATAAAAVVAVTLAGLVIGYRREQDARIRMISETARAAVEKARAVKTEEVAQARFDVTIGTVDRILALIESEPLLNAPGTTEVRDKLLSSVRQSLLKLGAIPGTGSPQDARTRDELLRKNDTVDILHDRDPVTAARRELAHARAWVDDHPGVPVHREVLAISHLNLGNELKATGKLPEAFRSYQAGWDLLTPLIRDHPTEPSYRANLAKIEISLDQLQAATGVLDRAIRSYQSGLDRLELLVREHPTVARYRADLARAHNTLGILRSMNGTTAEALVPLRRALELRQELIRDYPTVAEYHADLAKSYLNLGNLHDRAGRRTEAFQSYQAASDVLEGLSRDHPTVAVHRLDLATSHNNLGVLHLKNGRPAEASRSFKRALELGEVLVREAPSVAQYRVDLARNYNNLGGLRNDVLHDPAEALQSHRRALDLREGLSRDNSAVVSYRDDLADSHFNLGLVHLALKRPDEEIEAYRKALDLREVLVREDPEHLTNQSKMGILFNNLGMAQLRLGRPHEALASLLRAVDSQRKALAKAPQEREFRELLSRHFANLATIQLGLDRPADAFATTLERRALCAEDGIQLHRVACHLARCISLVGRRSGVLAPDAQEAERSRYADTVMETLRMAIDAGYEDVAGIEQDAHLDPLKSREDFQVLVTMLKGRDSPPAKGGTGR